MAIDTKELLIRPERRTGQILGSDVEKIAFTDPVSFFAAGSEQYEGRRFFWADPAMDRVFVGLGAAYEIEGSGLSRYAEVERQWQEVMRTSVVKPNTGINGTGPIIFGGFSFDPSARKTELWRSFSDGLFVVPEFLLTVTNGECWLTVNRMVDAHDSPVRERQRLLVERNRLLNEARQSGSLGEHDTTVHYALTDVRPEVWKGAVAEAAKQIRAGEIDKVALAREIRVDLPERVDVAQALKRLCVQQQESYVFAIERGEDCFLGASPEQLVKLDGDKLYSTCLASSIGRGQTEEEDVHLGQKLLNDERFIIEHKVVVQMIKAAMESGCDHVVVPDEPTLFKAKYIQHLHTPVTGVIRRGTTLLSMVKQLHPTPALGGYPQHKAVDKIRAMEKLDRGWYAAPVGWMDRNGNGEFIGAIRSGIVRGKQASLFVGNGIVGDSEPESEFVETELKTRPMLLALGGAE